MLTQERLKELLDYNPETGEFKWLNPSGPRVRSGDAAGKPRRRGYSQIRIDTTKYQAHRLAWLYVHGEWPKMFIDHMNGIKSDNRIENLRDVSNLENCQNSRTTPKSNTSGWLGAYKSGSKFTARICYNWRQVHLGTYDTAEKAHRAYLAAKRKYHVGFLP